MHRRDTKHFQYGLLLLTPKGKKRNYLHGKAQQVKEEREIFLGFHFNTTTTSMEIKLTNFFGFS